MGSREENVSSIEIPTPLFMCKGECREFEEFLKTLDEMVGDIKDTVAEKHRF